MNLRKSVFPVLLFFVAVIAPTTIAAVYYGKIASEQFTTESRFIIQSNSQKVSGALGMFSGFTGMAPSVKDSLILEDYILSGDFLAKLSKEIDIKQIYSSPEIDRWAKLPSDASKEDTLEYWRDLVEISNDSSSGISTLEVTSFNRETAVIICNKIIHLGEIFVNLLSKEARDDALKQALEDVSDAEQELDEVRRKIFLFNNEEKVINPQQRATSEESIVSGLSLNLANKEAELTRLSSFMQPNAMKLKALKSDINSIKKQINRQQQKWKQTNPQTGKSVTTLVQSNTQLLTELAFAEKLYESAVSALRASKREVSQQQRYLEVIISPQLPDAASKPEVYSSTFTVFLSFFMGWGIFSLLIASVKDHMGWV